MTTNEGEQASAGASSSREVSVVGENGDNNVVSMQVVQDIYNEITGKSEELTKGYSNPIQVSFEDIIQLNYKITQMYEQYNISSNSCTVTVYHSKDQKQVFSSFERFTLYDRSNTCHA